MLKTKRPIQQIEEIELLDPTAEEFSTYLIYGPSGTGKTVLASTFPKPMLIVDTKERGYSSIAGVKGIKVAKANSWAQFLKVLDYINKDRTFATVVIDGLTGLQNLRLQVETGKDYTILGWGTLTQQQYGTVAEELKTVLYDLKSQEDFRNIVYLGHMRFFDEENTTKGLRPENNVRLMPSIVTVANGLADVIATTFIMQKEIVRKEKAANGKVIIKKETKTIYCLQTGPNPVYVTKVRTSDRTTPPDYLENPTYDSIVALQKGKQA